MPKAASIEELLKSGAHFGHLTRRWNPKMKDFIFMQRNNIHIIDLKKTQHYLQDALDEIQKLSRAGMPFVTHRWLGGMLTNFSTVRKSISRMEEIERMKTDGTMEELTKKEGLMLAREQEKLENTLGGIANLGRLPGAIFVVDILKEHLAVNEAIKLHIPVIAMVDTNSDPDVPDFIIPCNDDSARTIQLVSSQIADAIIEGAAEREAHQEDEVMESAASEAKEDNEAPEVKTKLRSRKKKSGDAKKKADEPTVEPVEADAKEAADVKKLRDMTGAGMMDCKKALSETDGDFEAAVELLRKKGQKVADKRADRDAKEGLILSRVSEDAKKAVAIEVNCETDFVARNEDFQAQADGFLNAAYEGDIDNIDDLLKAEVDGKAISDHLQEMVGKIGEKIEISNCILVTTEGSIIDYIHAGNQLGVLAEFDGTVENEDVARDVAMQVAAMNPLAVTRDEVDATTVEKELEIAKEQLINEGKPAEIAEKAAQGKLRRFYEERVLLEQKFVKDNGITVKQYLEQNNTPLIKSFHRIQLGEEA